MGHIDRNLSRFEGPARSRRTYRITSDRPLSMASSAMARPQVGIERLPAARRNSGLEQRESMNCKSCRKRKIKCNRLRPTCEACKIFQCPCLYDAVPKKRGPKTDVLEALVKRIDGLEKKLSEERKNNAIASSSAVSDGSPRSGNPPSVGGASPRTEVGSGQEQPSPREEQAQTIKRNLQVDTIFSPIQQRYDVPPGC
jgi:hypothetical protein